VTEAKSGQSKAEAAAVRAAKKAAEEADEERAVKELRTRRTMQLENSQAAVKKLEGELKDVRKPAKRCETLANLNRVSLKRKVPRTHFRWLPRLFLSSSRGKMLECE